jgi:hypothetical protein
MHIGKDRGTAARTWARPTDAREKMTEKRQSTKMHRFSNVGIDYMHN